MSACVFYAYERETVFVVCMHMLEECNLIQSLRWGAAALLVKQTIILHGKMRVDLLSYFLKDMQ